MTIRIYSAHVLRALTFGVSCALCISHYIRDSNADEFRTKFQCAVDSIQNRHYMNDLSNRVDTEESVAELALQVAAIHAAARCHIRNWASNSSRVLSQLFESSKIT